MICTTIHTKCPHSNVSVCDVPPSSQTWIPIAVASCRAHRSAAAGSVLREYLQWRVSE